MWRRYLRFLGPDPEADLDDELRFHLQMRADALAARGLSPAQAKEEALRRMGDLRAVRRACLNEHRGAERARRTRERAMNLAEDLRRAARGLRRAPGFTAVALLTLALGIGATTAIFTLLNAVVLRPLPYADAGRLVRVQHPVPGLEPGQRWDLSQAGYLHFRENAKSLQSLGVYFAYDVNLSDEQSAERVTGVLATASLFDALGARPALGRLYAERDDRPGGPEIVVLGHAFWTRRFGADPSVVGKTLRINARPVEVIGVLAKGTDLPGAHADVWRPMRLDPAQPPVNSHFLAAVGRLAPDASPERARAELARLQARFTELFPGAYDQSFMREYQFGVDVVSLRETVVGPVERVMWILLGSVGVVLLIACANVANLFLVRAESRRREVAVRTALGAGRGDLARLGLTESFLLAGTAAALGLLLAHGGLSLLLAMQPAGIPRLDEVRLGWEGVAFAAAVALGAGAVFGLFPLLRAKESMAILRDGGRGMTPSRRQHAVRGALVVGQVALALVLLAAAGLMLRTFQNLRGVHPGVEPRGVLTLGLALPGLRYEDDAAVARFHQELARRLEALPGVEAVGATNQFPLAGGGGCSVVFVEDTPNPPGGEPPCVRVSMPTPGYFEAMGIPVRGSVPTWSDVQRGAAGVVVSRALAERFWPGQDPIGKGIRGNGWARPFYRVVGVAGDVRGAGLDQPPTEEAYFPVVPMEGAPLWGPQRAMGLAVRTSLSSPAELAPAIRRVVAELDREVPVANVRTLEGLVARSMARVSFTLMLLGTAAAMALLLSAVGIYGVVSYIVGQRRAEIGVRMALGARIAQVGRMVVMQSLRLAALGVALGLAGALLATRALASMLYDVAPTDPLTLAAVAALLVALAAAASYLPARRAARVDPAEVLRGE